ncbi:MAG: family 43 glycosylhydrolase [Clostridia bacterium]|nr:family 43 glycosylhydrolase [Clostridia bacterium]
MKCSDINIRDPFVIYEDGTYYMYGTRAKDFGIKTGGFDVYISADLDEWSEPHEVFNSAAYGLNKGSNWAPEVHFYKGAYYMFATFIKPDGLRGTYILRSSSPMGPFEPHSEGSATPDGWECLDGTFYVENGEPYLVFSHEHTQIIDGTVCYVKLSADLTHAEGEAVTLFKASDPHYVDGPHGDNHYVTDGPFMFRTKSGELLMLWSTFPDGNYAECLVKFEGGSIKNPFVHLDPLTNDDGGHGMLFKSRDGLCLTFHRPNTSGSEHPVFIPVKDEGGTIALA